MGKQIDIVGRMFDFVYEMAMNDALNRVSDSKSDVLINDDVKKTVKDYSDVVTGVKKKEQETDVNRVIKKVVELSNGKLTFGNGQKLVNMTFKYLYIEYRNSDSADFSVCHAPMDSIMRDFVIDSYYIVQKKRRKRGEYPGVNYETAWSTLLDSTGEYESFQSAIKTIIDAAGLKVNGRKMNPVEFDYEFWGEAKRIKSKKTRSERKRETEKLWNEYINS